MAFEFQADENVSNGIKRIEAEEIDDALHQLTQRMDPAQRDKAIHDARKSFKRLRAVVRLMRDELGAGLYQRENATFRDAGRTLSDARDAKVLVDAFDAVLKHFESEVVPELLLPLREILVHRHSQLGDVLSQEAVDKVIVDIKAARERVVDWPLRHQGWQGLDSGLRRIYAGGRSAFDVAYKHPAFETFHEWRKRVKDLWYALELLTPVWPELMQPLGDEVHLLSDHLGDDHDLAVLRQTIQDDPAAQAHHEVAEALVRLIDARRDKLQRSAKALGERIFADKPKQFVRRLRAYWHAWHTSAAPVEPTVQATVVPDSSSI